MLTESVMLNPARPHELMLELKAIFSSVIGVSRLYAFGSMARGDWDRWSDIDLLIVTAFEGQFLGVWEAFHAAKPVIHHHPFSRAEPSGAHALGNVFEGESVFHCLDLNFLTEAEANMSSALERFGPMKELYRFETPAASDALDETPFIQELSPAEEAISFNIHFTKKNVKRLLRGHDVRAEVNKYADLLRRQMAVYPPDYRVVGGNIGYVAHTYLAIVDELLPES